MINHYNAFISYRHAPLDIKVAAEVQRRLEQFKVPAAIRKATGLKKIDRIFRDKEELPITSDLNETIENALNNSDYLIVICSHSTKESIWVQREIEFFLKTHSRKQVLTVLVEGEPGEVIPEILRQEVVEEEDDFGEKRGGRGQAVHVFPSLHNGRHHPERTRIPARRGDVGQREGYLRDRAVRACLKPCKGVLQSAVHLYKAQKHTFMDRVLCVRQEGAEGTARAVPSVTFRRYRPAVPGRSCAQSIHG